MKVVDSMGNLLAVKVFEANRHDGPVALDWWYHELSAHPFYEAISLIKGDKHYGGKFKDGVEKSSKIKVQVSHDLIGTATGSNMPLHKGRWVVERTNAWDDNNRRLSKDYERFPKHSEAFCLISSIRRLINTKIHVN